MLFSKTYHEKFDKYFVSPTQKNIKQLIMHGKITKYKL